MNPSVNLRHDPAPGSGNPPRSSGDLVRLGGSNRRRRFALADARPMGPASKGLWCLVATLACLVPAAASTMTFDQANQAYALGHYAEAARAFDQLMAREGYSAPLLFNDGNAWLKAGERGRAILSYERAQVLAPRDAAIAHNLARAREEAGVTVPAPGTLQAAARLLSWNELTWLTVIAAMLFGVSLLTRRAYPGRWRRAVGSTAVGSAIAGCALAGAMALRWPELNRAIVVAGDTAARIAPADAAGVSFPLTAGQAVEAGQRHGHFVFVRTEAGESGWVKDSQVAAVMVDGREVGAAEMAEPLGATGHSGES